MPRPNETKEQKFKRSLESWGEDECRPMMREKETPEHDKFVKDRQQKVIDKEKEKLSYEHGVPAENINLWGRQGPSEYIGKVIEVVNLEGDDNDGNSNKVATGYLGK